MAKKHTAPYKCINVLGRKRYSGDCNAKDVIDNSFDDCWRAICRLYLLTIIGFLLLYRKKIQGR